jgi:putative spermidine/putrescine transport system permease protein
MVDRPLEAGASRRWVMLPVVALIYVFLLGPILIVVLTSFTSTNSTAFPPEGFSLRWYGEFFRADNFTDAFWFSIKLASLTAPVATTIGFLSAYSIIRFGGRRREIAQSMSLLPAMVPHILISMSLLLALNFVPLPGFGALLAGHVLICLPFAIAGVTASLDGVDAHLESAALTLGASRLRALWEIVLPLTAPGIVSALLFTFIISFGDVYIALFLSGPGMTTLPIEIYSQIQWESTPVISAITSLQILLILILGLFVERLVGMRRIMRV